VHLSRFLLDAIFEDHALESIAKAAITADMAIRAEAQHALAAMGFFGSATEADVDKALDDVLRGLRAVEGLEEGMLVGHASKGFVSVEFARLVEEAVKAKLKAEARGLIKAKLVGKAAPRDEFDRFALNAAVAVEVALSLVYEALGQKWDAVARVSVVENYAHVFEKSPRGLKVLKRDVVHYLRYEAGEVAHGGARAEGVVVLVFLGGEKTIRVEVLAKSAAGPLPVRFEEVEWGGERWLRLAAAWINKPSKKKYIAQIEPGLRLEDKVNSRATGVEALGGLLVTDASGKWIKTPDPLLVKLFIGPFKEVKVKVAGVSLTEAGPVLQFRAVALDEGPFEKLFGDIAKRYGKGLWFIVGKAREMWRETVRKLYNDIKRIADESAEVGRREGVEAGRRTLVEGLRRLFEEGEREALNAGRGEEALTVAVAGRLTLGIVNSQWGWFSLLVGDGAVDIGSKTFGFSAKYTEVAEAVLRLLAVWAGAYGARTRVIGVRAAVYSSSEDATRVLGAVLTGEVLKYATALAKSWSGLAGSNAPKLISLLALAQLLGVAKGRWAVELWLAHKAATTLVEPEAAKALEGLFARVEGVDKVEWEERGVNIYFRLRDMEETMFRLYTNFANFHLYCDSCIDEVSARRVLEAVAEWLRPVVKQLGLAAEGREWPRWHKNALDLPASVGWPMFLKLWAVHKMSLRVEEDGRELLRVEVLDVGLDGSAKFRLWYHEWHKTRPHQPYVDVEITYKGEKQGFIGHFYANKAKGILREHMAEIAQLLRDMRVEGVSLVAHGKQLRFTGAFRDSVLARFGIKPELSPGEPPAVQHLGGLRFKVGDREVEFGPKAMGARREFYAEPKFLSRDEAVNFARSLRAIGVDAEVVGSEDVGYAVRLDSDAFFGLLAVTNAVPPGLTLLYCSNDLRLYASVEEVRMRYYFAVKSGGVWRAVNGLYKERDVQLFHVERDVLETVRIAVARALEQLAPEKLGLPAKVEEPKEERDKEGKVKGYYFHLYGPHFAPFLEYAADSVEAEPAEVRLEGKRIMIKAGGFETVVEFKLLKGNEADFLLAHDIGQTLALYKSLKEVGVPVEITPKGVKVDGEAMWALVVAAVEKTIEHGKLPAEVMPGLELLNVHNVGKLRMYVFRASDGGAQYYFAVKTEEGWRAAGGKYRKRNVQIYGEAVPIIAKAINAIYREMGMERRVEVRQMKDDTPYIRLTNVDLELLGLRRP